MAFRFEKFLVKKALESSYIKELKDRPKELTSYWDTEIEGLFGIPDLVIFYTDPEAVFEKRFVTIAFEMKLSKWEKALGQAYRYKSFANKSYVMMDNAHISPPLRNITRFQKANIGLLSIDDSGKVTSFFEPEYRSPFSPWIERVFLRIVFHQEHNRLFPLYFDNLRLKEAYLI